MSARVLATTRVVYSADKHRCYLREMLLTNGMDWFATILVTGIEVWTRQGIAPEPNLDWRMLKSLPNYWVTTEIYESINIANNPAVQWSLRAFHLEPLRFRIDTAPDGKMPLICDGSSVPQDFVFLRIFSGNGSLPDSINSTGNLQTANNRQCTVLCLAS